MSSGRACTGCGEHKEAEEFYRFASTGKLSSRCRSCTQTQQKEKYLKSIGGQAELDRRAAAKRAAADRVAAERIEKERRQAEKARQRAARAEELARPGTCLECSGRTRSRQIKVCSPTCRGRRSARLRGQKVTEPGTRNRAKNMKPVVKPMETSPAGRTCAERGCSTILSLYNPAEKCAAHHVSVIPFFDLPPTQFSIWLDRLILHSRLHEEDTRPLGKLPTGTRAA